MEIHWPDPWDITSFILIIARLLEPSYGTARLLARPAWRLHSGVHRLVVSRCGMPLGYIVVMDGEEVRQVLVPDRIRPGHHTAAHSGPMTPWTLQQSRFSVTSLLNERTSQQHAGVTDNSVPVAADICGGGVASSFDVCQLIETF